ncbi:unnamed protein product [Diamesa hyperborea]
MSNSNIFLKSGFIRAPLQNGLGRFVGQLQRITMKFCKNNGSSKGMRDFVENGLLDFAKGNPGTAVYLKPRRHRTPVIVAEYLNGDRQWINCRNNTNEEISKWVNLLRLQSGDTSSIRYRKTWQTEQPTIQGVWTPFTSKNPAFNLVEFPEQKLSELLNKEQSATEKLLQLVEQNQVQAKDVKMSKDE